MKYLLFLLFFLSVSNANGVIGSNDNDINLIDEINKYPICDRINYYESYAMLLEKDKKYKEALIYYNKTLNTLSKCYYIAQPIMNERINNVYYELSHITEILANTSNKKEYYAQSIEYTAKAIYQIESLSGQNDVNLYYLYKRLGLLLNKSNKYQKSYKFISKFINFYNTYKSYIFTVFGKSEKYNFNKQVLEAFDIYFSSSYMIKNLKLKKTVFNNWINFKGNINAYENALQSLRYYILNNPKILKRKKLIFLKKLKILKRYKQQYSISHSNKDKDKINELENYFSKKIIKYKRFLGLQKLNLKDIKNILKQQNALYIDFARTKNNYYIFTLNKFGQLSFDKLSNKKTKNIDIKIDTFRKEMKIIANNNGQIDKNEIENKINDIRLLLAKLYSDIFPLSIHHKLNNLKNNSTLIISLDGKLNFLPFEALVINDIKHLNQKPSKIKKLILHNKYLIEKFKIKYIPSAKELVRLHKFKKIKNVKYKNIAFLNPDFSKSSSTINDKSGILGTNITETCQKSILKLSALNTQLIKTFKEKMSPIVFQKDKATEKRLLMQSNVNILNITTHGIYCEQANVIDPMLKTMLILSGAKTSIKKGRKNSFDGIITALEISSMNLEGTKLVTLSACQTGLGQIYNSEGVASINKAFLEAGARNIISTLWNVAKNETQDFMNTLYAQQDILIDTSNALRKVKNEMIKLHPYYWSGFVLYGE